MNPEIEAKLSALLDGELAPDEAEALRAEIAARPELAVRLAELAAVDEAVRALPARPVPPEVSARLAERIRGAEPARRAPPRRTTAPPRVRWLAAAALAAAVAALVLIALPRVRNDETQLARAEPTPSPELTDDLPVIGVLDVLTELDELEGNGSG